MNAISPIQHGTQEAQVFTTEDISKLHTRLDVFTYLQKHSQLSEFGIPKLLYRPDLLTADLFNLEEADYYATLNNAEIQISMREGFPTLEDGTPLWGQLPWETKEGLHSFKEYLNQVEELGVRQLSELKYYESAVTGPLNELFVYNYWHHRCRAYDLFQVVQARKLREKRILRNDDLNYVRSQKLMNGLYDLIEESLSDNDKRNNLGIKDAVKAYKDIYAVQRTALGQPAIIPGKDPNATPPNASIEVTMKQIATQAGDLNSQDESVETTETSISMLLSDPETAENAQALIISMTQTTQVSRNQNQNQNQNNPKVIDHAPVNPLARKHLNKNNPNVTVVTDVPTTEDLEREDEIARAEVGEYFGRSV